MPSKQNNRCAAQKYGQLYPSCYTKSRSTNFGNFFRDIALCADAIYEIFKFLDFSGHDKKINFSLLEVTLTLVYVIGFVVLGKKLFW